VPGGCFYTSEKDGMNQIVFNGISDLYKSAQKLAALTCTIQGTSLNSKSTCLHCHTVPHFPNTGVSLRSTT
jgi:hypothetical protein